MAAIYMWVENVEINYTTTLYPAEIAEGISLSTGLDFIVEWEVITDSLEGTHLFTAASRLDVLIELPAESDYVEGSHFFVGGSRLDVLLELPPESDYIEGTHLFTQGSRQDVLIEAYVPEQNIQLSVDVDPDSFTAT